MGAQKRRISADLIFSAIRGLANHTKGRPVSKPIAPSSVLVSGTLRIQDTGLIDVLSILWKFHTCAAWILVSLPCLSLIPPPSPPGKPLLPMESPSYFQVLFLCVWFTELIRIVAPACVGGYLMRHRERFSGYYTFVTWSDILENTEQRTALSLGGFVKVPFDELQALYSWWEWDNIPCVQHAGDT